jgi:hypothetical protein
MLSPKKQGQGKKKDEAAKPAAPAQAASDEPTAEPSDQK